MIGVSPQNIIKESELGHKVRSEVSGSALISLKPLLEIAHLKKTEEEDEKKRHMGRYRAA